MAQSNIWLITGTTSGIGAVLAKHLAARGDRVIATGRNATTRLADQQSSNFIPFDLDVTASLIAIRGQIQQAIAIFGHIDMVISNAGCISISSIEEATEDSLRNIFDTNLFGSIKITQAILPHFRERRAGRIGYIGAGFAWLAPPFMSHYAMSKAALSMFVETLQKEVGHVGIKVVVFEAGAFATDLGQPRDNTLQREAPTRIPDYQVVYDNDFGHVVRATSQGTLSDIEKIPSLVWDVMKEVGMADGRRFPIRVPVGADALSIIRRKCEDQIQLCDDWSDMATCVSSLAGAPNAGGEVSARLSILPGNSL